MLTRNTALKGIYTLPTEAMFKKIYSSRMKPILETDSIFNPPGEKPVRSSSLIQIRDSFGYIVGNTAGEATSIDADFLIHDEPHPHHERSAEHSPVNKCTNNKTRRRAP